MGDGGSRLLVRRSSSSSWSSSCSCSCSHTTRLRFMVPTCIQPPDEGAFPQSRRPTMLAKRETRNPKSETSNKHNPPNPQRLQTAPSALEALTGWFWGFRSFGFGVCFGFRASDFGFPFTTYRVQQPRYATGSVWGERQGSARRSVCAKAAEGKGDALLSPQLTWDLALAAHPDAHDRFDAPRASERGSSEPQPRGGTHSNPQPGVFISKPGAAPRPIPRLSRQTGLYRIHLDIPPRFQLMICVPDIRIPVILLPQAPGAAQQPVRLPRRARLPRAHNLGHRHGRDLEQDVHVIGHHHPGTQVVSPAVTEQQGLLHQPGDLASAQATFAPPQVEIGFEPPTPFAILFDFVECLPFGAERGWKGTDEAEGDELNKAGFVPMRQITAFVPASEPLLCGLRTELRRPALFGFNQVAETGIMRWPFARAVGRNLHAQDSMASTGLWQAQIATAQIATGCCGSEDPRSGSATDVRTHTVASRADGHRSAALLSRRRVGAPGAVRCGSEDPRSDSAAALRMRVPDARGFRFRGAVPPIQSNGGSHLVGSANHAARAEEGDGDPGGRFKPARSAEARSFQCPP